MPRILPETAGSVDTLWSIVEAASSQRHGTMLIVSLDAEEEVKRLRLQSTTIDPPVLADEDLIRHITSIDGAIVLDPLGKCHAFGVILDGTASPEIGDSSRGARYNSALRYVECQRKAAGKPRCFALIVSEDGYSDIYPNLLLRISYQSLLGRIELIETASLTTQVMWAEVLESYRWLSKRKDYLSEENVRRLRKAEANFVNQEPIMETVLSAMRYKFNPNPKIDDSYFT